MNKRMILSALLGLTSIGFAGCDDKELQKVKDKKATVAEAPRPAPVTAAVDAGVTDEKDPAKAAEVKPPEAALPTPAPPVAPVAPSTK